MKKYLLFFSFSLIVSLSFAQTDSFCEISSFPSLRAKCKITMDFGQYAKIRLGTSDQLIVDENGADREFNSMIDALNFLVSKGWEFVQAYSASESGGASYILKWKGSKGEPYIPKIKGNLKSKI